MSHGQGVEENTVIYSIIFPSQSPFIDFKVKGTGSALKVDEKLSTAEMDTLPRLHKLSIYVLYIHTHHFVLLNVIHF